MAFVQNPEVKALLQSEGTDVLPLFFIDGELALKGAYPDHDKRREWLVAHQKEATQ